MGLMCSVARSAQADMQRVESRRMTRARQRDQWTTALWWWPGTGGREETGLDTLGRLDSHPRGWASRGGDTHCDSR